MNAQEYLSKIKTTWKQLQQIPEIFAYSLNVTEKKYLPGRWRFYIELNPERSSLRRAPQQIDCLNPTFDDAKFNFTNINQQERILDIPYEKSVISMVINRSPLKEYHSLICHELDACQPQIITKKSLEFCIQFLLLLKNDHSVRIGYNSPGALASVNHLHLHLLVMDVDLYIDKVDLEPLADDFIYRLSRQMPTEAICFIIERGDKNIALKLEKLYTFLQWLCKENHPHNLFMTPSRNKSTVLGDCIKIFVYVREKATTIKDLTTFNIGFCELAGFITVGSKELFDNLTEEDVTRKIRNETGDVFNKIYNYFLNVPIQECRMK